MDWMCETPVSGKGFSRGALEERLRWDNRYRTRKPRFDPSPLLVRYAELLTGGRALDLACGTGRNALFLARRGYCVDAVDISGVALTLARCEAERRGLLKRINFVQADAAHLPLAPTGARYDCIVVFRFLLRSIVPQLRRWLRPGGLVFYSTFNVRRLESHPEINPAYLVEIGELPTMFPDFEVIVAYDEGEVSAFVGRSPREAAQAARSSVAYPRASS